MGSICCCLPVDDFERYIQPNSAIYRYCLCISCFTRRFLNVRAGLHAVPSSVQGATPLTSITPSINNSVPDTYQSPPRPLPYNFNPRCFHSHRDGRLSRHEKASSHPIEESEPLRSSSQSEPLGMVDKWNSYLMKYWSTKVSSGEVHVLSSSEDEDVCPTCLEEYTHANPKIMTQCSHHFHLSCIYEWKERSESCPMCGKASSHSNNACLETIHFVAILDLTVHMTWLVRRPVQSSSSPHIMNMQKNMES